MLHIYYKFLFTDPTRLVVGNVAGVERAED